jgi:dipeptidyl aminopeptidase/acylaminoacyl peptidase
MQLSACGLRRRPWLAGSFAIALLSSVSLPATAAETPAVTRIERGNLALEGVPEIPQDLAERMRAYQATRGASLEGWTADGAALITTRFGETAQVHRVTMPGGARTQLTFHVEPVLEARPAPTGRGYVFAKDQGGDEFYQLWHDDGVGTVTRLTEGRARNTDPVWSNRGDRIAFSSTRRNGRDTDVHVVDLATRRSHSLIERDGTWTPLDWSPDDRWVLAQKYISINQSELWLLPTAPSGEARRFHPSDHAIAFGPARFSRDGRGLYYVSDEHADVRRLRYEQLDGSGARVLGQTLPWDVKQIALSPAGAYLAYVTNVDGFSDLRVIDLRRDRRVALPALPRGVIDDLNFDRTGRELGFVLNNARHSSDVYSIRLSQRSLRRWTSSETGGLDASGFVEPELVHFDSFDGRSIPAFYYRAPHPGPRPVLIQIHGGPEAQALPLFSPITEFHLRELGISVLVPNVRGSDGYGKTYLQLDNAEKREDSVRDIGALLDWIAHRPGELDASRVAVAGGSYGGYMTLASMAHFDDRLRCGIDTVGISNFVTFLTQTQEYRRDLRRAEYGDERDPAMRAVLERISPTTNAHRIAKPLFVIQGANDPRVPATEAEQIVETVRAQGGRVWYLLAKDEGHGFRKKPNRDLATAASALFLRQCLGTEADD